MPVLAMNEGVCALNLELVVAPSAHIVTALRRAAPDHARVVDHAVLEIHGDLFPAVEHIHDERVVVGVEHAVRVAGDIHNIVQLKAADLLFGDRGMQMYGLRHGLHLQ